MSTRYDISISDISKSLASGTLIVGNNYPTVDVIGIVHKWKESECRDAERRGYCEAKELYENKIKKMQEDLAGLKNRGNREIQEMLELINELFDAISQEQMKIAELEILL